jgi:hypothetical protein
MTHQATKPIIADPMKLYTLGVRNLMDMAILVHVGRCGLVGCGRQAMASALGVSYETARSGIDRLEDLGMVTAASRSNGIGRAFCYVVTLRGWNLLTEPADLSLFPHAQLALKTQ